MFPPKIELHQRLTFDRGTLAFRGFPADFMSRNLGGLPIVWDPRSGTHRCDASMYPQVAERLEAARLRFENDATEWETVAWKQQDIHKLRPEQIAAVDAWLESGRGCVVMPTGTGKTEVALSLMARTSVSTLVVAPVRDLMYQWHRRIHAAFDYDAGIIGDNIYTVRPVCVTTYDSACIHMERLGNRFEMIVFDECHHLPGNLRRDAARMCSARYRLGLTATPERSDGRHSDLESLIGPCVYEMKVSQAKGRTLANYEVVRIPVFLSDAEQQYYDKLSETVRQFMADRREDEPDFTWQDVNAEANSSPEARKAMKAFHAKKAVEDRAEEKLRVLEDLFRLHNGQRSIVFVGSNAMARDVSRRFLIPCLLNHCGKAERLDILQGFENGDYPAIVANQVLDEGVDLPSAKVAIVIGGSGSTRQAKQRLGRILRKASNEQATLYEVVCRNTREEGRSRQRRSNDAYKGTRHRQL